MRRARRLALLAGGAALALLVWPDGPRRTSLATGAPEEELDAARPGSALAGEPVAADEAPARLDLATRAAGERHPAPSGAPEPGTVATPTRVGVRVVDQKGAAVTGAEVQLLVERPGTGITRAPGETDAQGEFTVVVPEPPPGVPLPSWLTADVVAEGFGPGHLRERVEVSSSRVVRTLVLESGAVLTVRVLDAAGLPVDGASVLVRYELQEPRGQVGVHLFFKVTDARGEALFGLRGRRFEEIVATTPNQGRADRELSLEAEEDVTVELVLAILTVTEGRVTCPHGVPLPGVWLQAAPPPPPLDGSPPVGVIIHGGSATTTDAEGGFSLVGLEPGRWQLLLPGDLEPLGFEAGDTLDVVLPDAHLLVEVVDDEGIPDLDTPLELHPMEGGSVVGRLSVAPMQRLPGLAHFGPLEPGEYVVRGPTPDGWAREERVTLPRDACVVRHRFIVAPLGSGTLRLRLATPAGDALPGARVELLSPWTEETACSFSWSPDDGPALVPAGTLALWIEPESTAEGEIWLPLERPVTIERGRTTELSLVAERGGRLRVTLRPAVPGIQPPGRGVSATIELVPPRAGEPEQVMSERLGTPRESDPLRPGVWRLVARAEGYAPLEALVTVRAGEVTEYEATLVPE